MAEEQEQMTGEVTAFTVNGQPQPVYALEAWDPKKAAWVPAGYSNCIPNGNVRAKEVTRG